VNSIGRTIVAVRVKRRGTPADHSAPPFPENIVLRVKLVEILAESDLLARALRGGVFGKSLFVKAIGSPSAHS